MKLQRIAVESVKGRGFYEAENLPPQAHNIRAMEISLRNLQQSGIDARLLRKMANVYPFRQDSSEHFATTLYNTLLMAQMLRLREEVGELADELLADDIVAAQVELADVAIVLYQIAECLGCDLETMVMAKLKADEKRGKLHGEIINGEGVTA